MRNEIEHGKLVHASQKLAHSVIVSISFREKSWQNWYINLTVRINSEPYDIQDWSGLTWAVKTEPSDRLDGDGCLYSLDWTTGLTQTAIICPFQCRTGAHSLLKVAPLTCWGIVSMVEAFFLKSVEVKGHMHILISIYLVQTCQVTLISRVRPTFWPVNQHLLLKIWISTDGVTSILESLIPHTLH